MVQRASRPPAAPGASSPTSNCGIVAAPAWRTAKDTGLRNRPLHELDQNRIWQAVVALACDITAWTQMLALTEHPARGCEPKRLRLRIISLPADLARHARTVVLHLPAHAPRTPLGQHRC